ncbi:branched-chain amino acid ABC transporter permease [Paraburkholderia sp. HD33-4]|uniref:branched-chain amino acid ABC transporter permease n=1 Tax=Paraburkholderia sp. HD33-4 TaxID=2883242 RepID=UPI001F42A243|nr:branched-chain amino acid ABC transporter permease [Paraburkholderia sp. HD33-4]
MVSLYAMQALHGLVYGMLLFLVASGLTLIFGLLRVLNIAHAAFYMLGAYLAYAIVTLTENFWLSLFVAPTIVGLLGAAVEYGLLRRIRGHGHEYELLLTLGLFYMISDATRWIWGNYTLEVPTPSLLVGSIPLLGGLYPKYRLFILAFSGLICVLMGVVLKRTRLGIVILSCVSDREMVSTLGIDTALVMTTVFGFGSALAAIAGVVAAPFLQVDPSMGQAILVDTFVVVVIGGFGSLSGALIASILTGEIKSFGILFVPQFALVFQFLLMAAVLIVRPQGLLGNKP